jgi:hypothetical protein
MPTIEELLPVLPNSRVEAIDVPRGCSDGFFCALWDRPELYLDPAVRRAASVWGRLEPDEIEHGLARLSADLDSGRWHQRHGELQARTAYDVGLRLVTAELPSEHAPAEP